MVWSIASWADDDEQYKEEQPREGLFMAGGDELLGGVQSPFSLSLSRILIPFSKPFAKKPLFKTSFPLCGWLVLFIEALVLFPNIEREGSQQWRANLKGDN